MGTRVVFRRSTYVTLMPRAFLTGLSRLILGLREAFSWSRFGGGRTRFRRTTPRPFIDRTFNASLGRDCPPSEASSLTSALPHGLRHSGIPSSLREPDPSLPRVSIALLDRPATARCKHKIGFRGSSSPMTWRWCRHPHHARWKIQPSRPSPHARSLIEICKEPCAGTQPPTNHLERGERFPQLPQHRRSSAATVPRYQARSCCVISSFRRCRNRTPSPHARRLSLSPRTSPPKPRRHRVTPTRCAEEIDAGRWNH